MFLGANNSQVIRGCAIEDFCKQYEQDPKIDVKTCIICGPEACVGPDSGANGNGGNFLLILVLVYIMTVTDHK